MPKLKMCLKCTKYSDISNEVCPFCGHPFDISLYDDNPEISKGQSPSKNSQNNQTYYPKNSSTSNYFPLLKIALLIVIIGLIAIPTKTISENVDVPYEDTETYLANESYRDYVFVYEQETWQEAHTSSVGHESPEGYYWKSCVSPCSCSHYTSNPNTVPSYYCDECSCPNTQTYSQSRNVPVAKEVTKYRTVQKTRNVTKYRSEIQPAEVNWIFGFKTPYTFHLPFT